MQRERQVEAVVTSRLQNDTCESPALGDDRDELAVADTIIGKLELGTSLILLLDYDRKRLGADIDSHEADLLLQILLMLYYNDHRFPDPAPSPTRLVNAGSRASDTPRHG